MSDPDDKLAARHSFHYTSQRTPKYSVQTLCKSDFNIVNRTSAYSYQSCDTKEGCGEYYKKYDHDTVPVREFVSVPDSDPATGDNRTLSITNSELDKIEKQLISESQSFLPDNSNIRTLDSNIKFFKTTVEQIFQNFYTSMRDFELYKQKFNEILARNREESLLEMEEFVKDMLQHIISTESSLATCDSSKSNEPSTEPTNDDKDLDANIALTPISTEESDINTTASGKLLENLYSVVEAYKNDNYLTDSTLEDASKVRQNCKNGEIFNIYLLNSTPLVEIKMNDRNLLSEINIKDHSSTSAESKVASAEDLKKVAAKKMALEKFINHQKDSQIPDRDIPVKVSYAKKNIHTDEDFAGRDKEDSNKFFMFRICNYLCKKFRKNAG